MCKGAQEEKNGGLCRRFISGEDASHGGANRGTVFCELCGSQASLYCQADDAFLCRKCDQLVHNANFLARRHIRCFLCNTCQNMTQRYLIGASVDLVLPTMVSWAERSSLSNKSTQRKSSRMLKRPFLFL